MIYFSADDYGLCKEASMHIKECADKGAVNKISVFANFDSVDFKQLLENENVRIALHLNLVEGRCMAPYDEVSLICDENGKFKYTFTGLFRLNCFKHRKLEEQVYKEIKAQVLFWKNNLPKGVPLCFDSHQHTHMIPAVFKSVIRVFEEEKITPDYIRIPAEPVIPFLKVPSLYFTYSPVNIIKQWLLKFLWLYNKHYAKEHKIHKSYFLGILFSGKMDNLRVGKVLPQYIKLAEKNKRDIEILFHPGYLEKNETDLKNINIVFDKFYLSKNRKTEYDSAMKLKTKEVFSNALY